MSTTDQLIEMYRRFDPEEPALLRQWRTERPHSPVPRIVRRLDSPVGEPRFLLLGTVGTGKSTELLRVAEARAHREFVVLLDLVRHFSEVAGDMGALQRINAWEVCFLAGLAVVRAAEQQLGHRWNRDMLKRLQQRWAAVAATTQPGGANPPELDLSRIARSMVLLVSDMAAPVLPGATAGLKLLEGAAGSIKWNLPIGLSDTRILEDQHTQIRDLLENINDIFLEFQRHYHRPVLMVIDGLDRIVRYEQARSLLIDSELIQKLECRLVVCGPFILRHHIGTAAIRRFQLETLVNEPVLDKLQPAKLGPGVRFFCDLYRQRIADLNVGEVVPADQIERLAYYSGGRARDFVKLIRELAQTALDEDATEITPELVTAALDAQRRLLEMGIDRADLEILEKVMMDPERRLPGGDGVFRLLSEWRLLPYPNESEWYYPHPMLTISLLKPRPGSVA